MKQKLQESLDRMKLLMEYSFKTNAVEENPVKFSEIGDKYKPQGNSDYPTFDEYKDAVIIDEDDPEDQTQQPVDNSQQQPQPQEQPPATPDPNAQTQQSVEQPPVAPDQVQQTQPDPNQQPAQVAAPVDQTQQVQEPQQSFEPTSTYDSDLDYKMNDQINKTNELLAKFSEIQNSLSNINVIQHQLNNISAEVDSIKNPSLEDNVENVIKQSYPFNVKMSDYFKDDEENDEPEIFKASSEDIDNYNQENIKNSFNI